MAWLSDEQYVLMQDTKDKKITARSARHTRTHCGKSGAVKFPSDTLTKKELTKMNGPVESYKMNNPITWEEFKKMPDDLKVIYVKAIREKYGVPDKEIAEMMGVTPYTLSRWLKCLGLGMGKNSSNAKRTWDKEGFYAWRSGASAGAVEHSEVPVEEAIIESDKIDDERDVIVETEYTPAGCGTMNFDEPVPANICSNERKTLVPMSGEMTFEGNATAILNTIDEILRDGNVKLTVKWEFSNI